VTRDTRRRGRQRRLRDSAQTADRRQHDGLDQKLLPDVARLGAQRLSHSDLPRTLGHRHQHDVHDDDTPDYDSNRDDRWNHGEQDLGEILPELNEGVSRLYRIIGLITRPQMVCDAHRLVGALHPARDELGGRHLHRDGIRLPTSIHHLEVGERQQDESIKGLAEHAPLFGDRSDHGESLAHDPDVLAYRVHVLEQLLGDVRADHRHVAVLVDVDIADRPTVVEHVVLNDLVGRSDAENRDVSHRLVAPDDIRDWRRPPRLQAHGERLRHGRDDRVRVRLGDARTLLKLAPFLVVEQTNANRRTSHLERVCADQRACEIFLDVRVHPRDDRDDCYEERNGHDDPEQREKRAQLVDADLFEGGCDYVGVAHVPKSRDVRPNAPR
jgi:hypothetical protein